MLRKKSKVLSLELKNLHNRFQFPHIETMVNEEKDLEASVDCR